VDSLVQTVRRSVAAARGGKRSAAFRPSRLCVARLEQHVAGVRVHGHAAGAARRVALVGEARDAGAWIVCGCVRGACQRLGEESRWN